MFDRCEVVYVDDRGGGVHHVEEEFYDINQATGIPVKQTFMKRDFGIEGSVCASYTSKEATGKGLVLRTYQ